MSAPLAMPCGNMLLSGSGRDIRPTGLGSLHRLDDTTLLALLALIPPESLLLLSECSRACFAYARHEPMWKNIYLAHANGILKSWHGGWRKSFLVNFFHKNPFKVWATDSIRTPDLYSDELFQPFLCIQTNLEAYFYPRRKSRTTRSTIPRHSAKQLDVGSFKKLYAEPSVPVIITDALSGWSGLSTWSLDSFEKDYPNQLFRAEALDCTISTYRSYAADCSLDDSPLYLFDSQFVEKTDGRMGEGYVVPEYFSEDLFKVMGDQRPNYRWLIVGPARSGSTFHKDPNHTSAWNAVISGRKGWVMFPSHILPPGVYVTPDEAEVTSPLSISEWFLSYFDEAWKTYGPHASDPTLRNKMLVGVCNAGEVLYVPSGWWHLVVNLDFSIAVTQNYVSTTELGAVLAFMRDRPEQVSGFKSNTKTERLDDDCAHSQPPTNTGDDDDDVVPSPALFTSFVNALREHAPDTLKTGLSQLEQRTSSALRSTSKREKKRPARFWDQVEREKRARLDDANTMDSKDEQSVQGTGGGFTFGFDTELEA